MQMPSAAQIVSAFWIRCMHCMKDCVEGYQYAAMIHAEHDQPSVLLWTSGAYVLSKDGI